MGNTPGTNSTSCGAYILRGRSSPRLVPGRIMTVAEMVRRDDVREEFKGLRMSAADVQTIIKESTAEVKQVTSLHPILFIGYGGQGKSSTINKLLDKFGTSVDGRRAAVGHRGSKTKNVDVYACRHATSVGDGEVRLLDTEGFTPGGTQQVLALCERVIFDQGVSKEVFLQRLVFVLVIGANAQGQRLAGAAELSKVVSTLAQKFCIGGDQVKPRMLVVLTHCDDMHQEEELRLRVCNDVRGIVDKAVGTRMAVEPPLFVSGKTAEGIPELVVQLKAIVEESLNSPELLGVIRRLLATNLVTAVKNWATKTEHSGLEASETLARRCAFAIVRLYGARWVNFHEKVTWREVDGLQTLVRRWTRPAFADRSGARYHDDNLRRCAHDLQSLAESTALAVATAPDGNCSAPVSQYVSLCRFQDVKSPEESTASTTAAALDGPCSAADTPTETSPRFQSTIADAPDVPCSGADALTEEP